MLAGDALLAEAFEAAASVLRTRPSPSASVLPMRDLAEAAGSRARGRTGGRSGLRAQSRRRGAGRRGRVIGRCRARSSRSTRARRRSADRGLDQWSERAWPGADVSLERARLAPLVRDARGCRSRSPTTCSTPTRTIGCSLVRALGREACRARRGACSGRRWSQIEGLDSTSGPSRCASWPASRCGESDERSSGCCPDIDSPAGPAAAAPGAGRAGGGRDPRRDPRAGLPDGRPPGVEPGCASS